MWKILILPFFVFFMFEKLNGQTIINLHLKNAEKVSFLTSEIDSVIYSTVAPMELTVYRFDDTTNYHYTIASIDSITYTIATLPELITVQIADIDEFKASVYGEVLNDRGLPVINRGFFYDTIPNPSWDNQSPIVYNVNGGIGTFSNILINLDSDQLYYVRSFATTIFGTAFGNELTFTTVSNSIIPTINTVALSGITSSSVQTGGEIISDGGNAITDRGICWSTSTTPTLLDNSISEGNGSDIYILNITGLNSSTTYYVRSYATNSQGTGYGNEYSFTTLTNIIPPSVVTTAPSKIYPNQAVSGGVITNPNWVSISKKGLCWSTNPSPDTLDFQMAITASSSTFSSTIVGLEDSTLYYLRAFIVYNGGVIYGNEVTFTTANFGIGSAYQGGIVAYVLQVGDLGYDANVVHGIVAANQDCGS